MLGRVRGAVAGQVLQPWRLAGCGSGAPLPPPQRRRGSDAARAAGLRRGLKPRRAGRPVIAVLALNEGTEMTDLLLPHAVLQRAGVADVQAVAPRRGRVTLYPALQVEGAQDLAGFDRAHPSGADYVIVPAMRTTTIPPSPPGCGSRPTQGARVIGVCAGALVRRPRRPARRPALRGPLVRPQHAAAAPSRRDTTCRTSATWSTATSRRPPASPRRCRPCSRWWRRSAARRRRRRSPTSSASTSWNPAHDSAPFGLDAGRALALCAQQGRVLARRALARRRAGRHGRHRARARRGRLVAHRARQRRGRIGHRGPVRLRSGLVLVAQSAAEGDAAPAAGTDAEAGAAAGPHAVRDRRALRRRAARVGHAGDGVPRRGRCLRAVSALLHRLTRPSARE